MNNKLLTRAEIAEQLGVSLSKASQLMKEMACVSLGAGPDAHKRVPQWALDAWINEHTIHPGAKPEPKRRKAAIRTTAGGWDPRYFEPDGRLKRRRA